MSASAIENPAPQEAPERQSDVLDLAEPERLDWIERAWRLFCSVKFMVVLMAMFAAAMALGTFLNPKEDALVDIERAYAAKPWVITLYKVFELYAPFKSWWFTLIILLLAMNNLASSIERLPRIFLLVRHPNRRLSDDVLRGIRLRRRVPREGLDEAKVRQAFEKGGYKVTRIEEGGTVHLFGERGSWTRFGVWAVHVALLVVCFGGIYGAMASFEGVMDLPENGGMSSFIRMREPDGTIIPKPLIDQQGHRFAIRCDDFSLERFKDGSARRFSSDLVVLDEQGKELHKKHIIVNDPLDWGGMQFYQASYSERPDQSRAMMKIVDTQTGETKSVAASPEQPFSLGDGRVRFTVVNYEKQFGELGPAVQVVREETAAVAGDGAASDSVKSSNFWVFANYPEFDKEFRGDRYGLVFEKLEPMYVTGIQVGHNPGTIWTLVGCFIVFAGLFVTFWTAHRRVWARLDDGEVVFAGAAHRNKDRFAREFEELLGTLGVARPAPRA